MADSTRAQARATSLQIGTRMREAREAAGLSREALAARLAVKTRAIGEYERGRYRISAGLLHALAGMLGRDIAWFFGAEAGCTNAGTPEARA